MKYAPLPSQSELLSLFDYRDGVLYWKNSTSNKNLSQPAGYVCKIHKYCFIRVNRVLYRSHRLIWCMFHGYEPTELDHINRDRTDNRIENLREVSRSQNNYNHPVRVDNTSGKRNVCWDKSRNSWKVFVSINKKRVCLGRFKDFDLACLVADESRDKYYRLST